MTEDKYLKVLRKYWGYPDFRGIQRNIIESIGSGKDTLGLMPTGGGKSLTFQVPAMCTEGVCIVITPLIALMKDQVAHLRLKGIPAAAIYTGMTRTEIITTLDNCIYGGNKFLYVSPERLSSEIFLMKLKHINVCFYTVDEAHCISQWGYDFRPSYLKIADIRKQKYAPILALTATATPEVADDIQDTLKFSERNVFRMSFERPNLTYVVRWTEDKDSELVHILKSVTGSSIVYVRSRKKSKEISKHLSDSGITSTFYHAGLETKDKDERQKNWQEDKIRVMVATNAFGMGIDKADVRTVIHMDCPDSPEAYFQEAGRAGRDGNHSYAILLYNANDTANLKKRINSTFPPKDYIRKVYNDIAYFYQIGVGSGNGISFNFPIDKFCYTFKHFPIVVDSALKILTRAGYLEYHEMQEFGTRIMFTLDRSELYRVNGLTPDENKVIITLLRLYGGLFTDFASIDDQFVADKAGMEIHKLYSIFKFLHQKHIIKYIPGTKTPFICYTRNRKDGEKLIFSPEIYELRKIEYEKRINAMIEYANNDKICHSISLLRYFGETKCSPCNRCDVCIKQKNTEKQLETAIKTIKSMFSDNKSHGMQELKQLDIDTDIIKKAIDQLLKENILKVTNGRLELFDN